MFGSRFCNDMPAWIIRIGPIAARLLRHLTGTVDEAGDRLAYAATAALDSGTLLAEPRPDDPAAATDPESPLTRILGVRMDMVYPVNFLRRLGRRDIEINHDRLLVITHDDTGKWFVLARIDLLMGSERWHVDEVARPRFGNELEALPPPHPRPTVYHVDHALQFPVVMRTRFSVGVDIDGTRPQLVCSGRGMRNGRRTGHARRLGGIEI